ncbi:MAG: hypothetical protein ACC652_11445 [Acidimicrobiales bacterium]
MECREDDVQVAGVLRSVQHEASRVCVDTERIFLAELGGGCDAPVGAYATLVDDTITVDGLIASLDGQVMLRSSLSGSEPSIGAELARQLMDDGGAAVLEQQATDSETS